MKDSRHPDDRFAEFDHTGDLGIEVWARTLNGLFELAATAMFSLLIDVRETGPSVQREIGLEGSDLEQLLLKWLSELNFFFLTEGVVFTDFEVREVGDGKLCASAFAEELAPDRHQILTEIKAVTYHDMVVEQRNDDRWYARIIFDI